MPAMIAAIAATTAASKVGAELTPFPHRLPAAVLLSRHGVAICLGLLDALAGPHRFIRLLPSGPILSGATQLTSPGRILAIALTEQ